MIYLTLFLTFFKIGAFTFGGGYAMIPLVQEEMLAHEWMSNADIVNFIAISESTPGPLAINMATFVGSQFGGFFGALCATVGVVSPSFIVILLVAKFYLKFKSSQTVSACMSGLRPAVIGMIGSAALSISAEVFFPSKITLDYLASYSFISTVIIFIISLIMIFKKINPIIIIVTSAVLGIASGYLQAFVT